MTPRLSALSTALSTALSSREDRWIRRRLPAPSPQTPLTDFTSNDYLSLSHSPTLRSRFLSKLSSAPEILGSGGSRLLVNGHAHADFEKRLEAFFGAEAALLFTSGFDANAGFFASVPQAGDVLVFDEHIHASVHDGMRASRVPPSHRYSFEHNSLSALETLLLRLCATHPGLRDGTQSLFLAVESLYSMDGTFAPLSEMVALLEEAFPAGNGYMVVDEAHATGVYGPQGRGRVAMLGLEGKVLARLVTFGKALAATGAVILTTPLVRDYLLNYARPLIYTTSLSYANIIAADCSFDMLEDGTAHVLATRLFELTTYFLALLRPHLASIPSTLLSLPPHLCSSPSSLPLTSASAQPSPIIPILTHHPRPLSAFLLALGMNARPITWPTVPKGKERVRVCLHAGNTREEVRALVRGVVRWAGEVAAAERGEGVGEGVVVKQRVRPAEDGLVESKL